MARRVDGGRRSLITGGSAAAALWLSGATAATAGISAYRLGIAEAAADDPDLAAFYRDTGFAGLWTGDGGRDLDRRAEFMTALTAVEDHGLPAARYDLPQLEARLRGARTGRDLGQLEVALSRLYLEYAMDLQTGFLTPGRIDPGLVLKKPERDRQQMLHDLAQGNPRAVIRALAPKNPDYLRLMREKFRLEDLAQAGGWGPAVPTGSTLRPGDANAAVIALRNRLIAMGYMRRTARPAYDAALVRALKRFQDDHGLAVDGVAGGATLAEVNKDVGDRLASVLVAMERERWMNMPLGDRHVWVNLTDFSAQIRDAGSVTFETRAVVGARDPDRQTPEFSDRMEMIDINPTWNVPRSIVVKEYLPKLQADPYAAQQLELIDRAGRVVDRSMVDFNAYTPQDFPFAMKQPPSDGNALGLVKFLFPNRWNIYLHDTPAKSLFQRQVRAFSHGCIRLHDPFDFAYTLLARQTSDPKSFFQSRLHTGEETVVQLDQPVPVHLTYRTAVPMPDGRVTYRGDVYGRDAEIARAMAAAGVAPLDRRA